MSLPLYRKVIYSCHLTNWCKHISVLVLPHCWWDLQSDSGKSQCENGKHSSGCKINLLVDSDRQNSLTFYSCMANNIIFTCLRELSLFTWRGGGVCGVWAKFFWSGLRSVPKGTIFFTVLDLGRAKSEAMKLDTGDRSPHRVPLFQWGLVDKIVNERLAINICKPSTYRST